MNKFGTVTTITFTRKELLALLFKLDRPDSSKAIIRTGEDGNEYYIQALNDTDKDNWELHPVEQEKYEQYIKFIMQ